MDNLRVEYKKRLNDYTAGLWARQGDYLHPNLVRDLLAVNLKGTLSSLNDNFMEQNLWITSTVKCDGL